MRYFVTGGTGFIGSQVVRMLLDRGHEVVVLARNPQKARALADRGARILAGDLLEPEAVVEGMRGADGVYHLAAWVQMGSRDDSAYRINVEGTRNVLSAMRDLEIPKGVYTSSVAVYSDTEGALVDETYRHDGPWLTEYDRTKWLAHYQVALPMVAEGLPLVIVQPGLVYGPVEGNPIQEAFELYLKRQLPVVPDQTAFSWTHVEDVAAGHLLAMEKGRIGESYNLTGPRHTLVETFALCEALTGIPAPRLTASPELVEGLAAIARLVETFVPLPVSMRSESLRSLAGTTYGGSYEKARAELGYDPRALEVGMAETLAHELRRLGLETTAPSA